MSWGKVIKREACRAFYIFFATSFIHSIIQEHEYYILSIRWLYRVVWCNTSKFCHTYATLLWVSFHNVTCSRESVNHQWFFDFNAWRYFTPRRYVIWYIFVLCLVLALLLATFAIIPLGIREREREFVVFLLLCDCSYSLYFPQGTVGWSAVCFCDCKTLYKGWIHLDVMR